MTAIGKNASKKELSELARPGSLFLTDFTLA